jgi:hypothetical protein
VSAAYYRKEEAITLYSIAIAKLLLEAYKILDVKLTDQDRAEYKKLLRALTDFRLLTDPYEAEFAGKVIESAQRLRGLLQSSAQALPTNSGLERGILALGAATRRFISQVERLEHSIRSNLDLIVANLESGVKPNDSDKELLAHWKRHGYPDRVLSGNTHLKVAEIQWQGYRMEFLLALGHLRGEFSILLSALCELTTTELPDELASLTPGIESISGNT